MKKLVSVVLAATLALGVTAAATAPTLAHHYDGGGNAIGAGLVGGMLGFMAGAAIAGSGPSHVYVYDRYDGPDYSYRDHVSACFEAYRSYDRRSDTYLGYDGYRHQCML